MSKSTKRYLVTYTDGSIETDAAVKLLGVTKTKLKDGVSFMESESVPSENDILHFESLGISSIELSETDANKLSSKDGVMAVEEDIEMYAINIAEDEAQYKELFMDTDEETDFEQDLEFDFEETDENGFKDGYSQALVDVFASLIGAKNNKDASGQSGPNFSMPIFPIRPILPPIFRNQPVPWNISQVKAPLAWRRGINGTGVKVAVLDTGIAKHPDLVISGGVSFIPGSSSYNDNHGHGTHCAGIIAARNNRIGVVGVAPNAKLYGVKVLSDSGSGSSSWIIAGMEWCVRNKMNVASMSLGGKSAPMTAYANAVKRCQDNGVTVVIASGNSYGSSFPWVCAPANSVLSRQPNASPIAVGAVDSRSNIAGFSSRGGRTSPWNQVWSAAPGVSVKSTYLRNGYRSMSGTSMACPHVAGLAALIVQRYPGISPANVKRRIATTSTDLGRRGYDQTYGYGLINCDRATR